MNVARYKHGKHIFEIVVDSDKALEFRQGKSVSLRDVLKADNVFSDAKKGLAISENLMKEVFGTGDSDEVAKQILMKGEIQLTAQHMVKLRDEKKRQVIQLIHTNSVDPRTHAPHPVTRIEAAIDQAKVQINGFKPAQEQLNDVLKKLRPIIPIKFETKDVQVIIGPEYAGKCYQTVKGFGTVLKEEWIADGSLMVKLELSAGAEAEFYDKVNSITHGNAEFTVLKTK